MVDHWEELVMGLLCFVTGMFGLLVVAVQAGPTAFGVVLAIGGFLLGGLGILAMTMWAISGPVLVDPPSQGW